MEKIESRRYLEKLNSLLLFYYEEDERASIINEYENYFIHETLLGKSESEICSMLESPKVLCKKIKQNSATTRHSKLLHNISLQMMYLTLIRIMIEFILFQICSNYSLNYFYFLLILNVVYFLCGTKIIAKPFAVQQYFKKEHLFLGFSALLLLIFEMFFVPMLKYEYSGIICSIILWIAVISLYVIGFYIILRKINKRDNTYFGVLVHVLGLTSVIFYCINELSLLYSNISVHQKNVYQSIYIYAVVILLNIIFYRNKHKKVGSV